MLDKISDLSNFGLSFSAFIGVPDLSKKFIESLVSFLGIWFPATWRDLESLGNMTEICSKSAGERIGGSSPS
jgi:hypothetical protein